MVSELDPEKGSFLEVYSSGMILLTKVLLTKVLILSSKTTCHLIYDYVSVITAKILFCKSR